MFTSSSRAIVANDLNAADEPVGFLDGPHLARIVGAVVAGFELELERVRVRIVVDAEETYSVRKLLVSQMPLPTISTSAVSANRT